MLVGPVIYLATGPASQAARIERFRKLVMNVPAGLEHLHRPWPMPVISPVGAYTIYAVTFILLIVIIRIFLQVRHKEPHVAYFASCALPVLVGCASAFNALSDYYAALPEQMLNKDFRPGTSFWFFAGAYKLVWIGCLISMTYFTLGLIASGIHCTLKKREPAN